MSLRVEPRFSDCRSCENFDPSRLKRVCLGCKAGENFDPKIEEEEPTEADLYGMLKEWSLEDA